MIGPLARLLVLILALVAVTLAVAASSMVRT